MKTKLQKLKVKAVSLAIAKKIADTPFCEACGHPASTAHHIVRQANSNYLRCKQYNLISTCQNCHLLAHSRGDTLAFGEALARRGEEWAKQIKRESSMLIKDNQGHWLRIIEELSK